jgi:hypothetical protein
MRAPALVHLLFACAAGCASAGDPTEQVASVPVFDSPEDVPCQYEVMSTVRGESPRSAGGSPAAYERERARVLGRVGARAGADAVLVEPVEDLAGVQRRAVVSAPAGSPPSIPPGPALQFEGEAIRYVAGTCSDGR